MKLVCLGTGSPEPSLRRASSGYMLEVGSDRILFDCGGGVFDRLLQAGYAPGDVTHIVFSHLHSDHVMDYARLVHAAWDAGAAPLHVLGPAPLAKMTTQLFGSDGVFAPDLRARTELDYMEALWVARGGTLPRPRPCPKVREIGAGEAVSVGDWQLSTVDVPHASPALTCLAFRLDAGSKTFVYSGDAALCAELETLSAGADLLLHWCIRLDGESLHPLLDALAPTPGEIGAMATRAGVGRLLLTHFTTSMDLPEKHAEALAAVRATFKGPVAIAEDLDVSDL
ncbi:MAG: MBL fold metallo-hydrolase [Pseudomonadota bacterium]